MRILEQQYDEDDNGDSADSGTRDGGSREDGAGQAPSGDHAPGGERAPGGEPVHGGAPAPGGSAPAGAKPTGGGLSGLHKMKRAASPGSAGSAKRSRAGSLSSSTSARASNFLPPLYYTTLNKRENAITPRVLGGGEILLLRGVLEHLPVIHDTPLQRTGTFLKKALTSAHPLTLTPSSAQAAPNKLTLSCCGEVYPTPSRLQIFPL